MASSNFTGARLKRLGTTATLEFHRLMRAGESALLHLPEQHGDTIREILACHGLEESSAGEVWCDLSLKLEQELWRPAVRWHCTKALDARKLPQQAISALCFHNLLEYIARGDYSNQPLEARLVVRNELLLMWWDLLVVPELEKRGVSRMQSRRASQIDRGAGMVAISTSSVQNEAAQLLRAGTPREVAKQQLVARHNLKNGTANKVLARAGYTSPRGRPKNATDG